VIDVLDTYKDEISLHQLDLLEENKDREWQDEVPGMPENQDDSDQGIMPDPSHSLPSYSSGQSVEHVQQDFDLQNAEHLVLVDTDFSNIAAMDRERANDPDVHGKKQNERVPVDVAWWVTVLVRVVADRAVQLLLECSCCQCCDQSCCQSCC